MRLKHPLSIDTRRTDVGRLPDLPTPPDLPAPLSKVILLLPALSALAGLTAFVPAGVEWLGLVTFLLITLGAVLLSTFLLGYELYEFRQHYAAAQSRVAAGKNGKPGKKIRSGFVGLSAFTGNLIALLLSGLTQPKNLLLLSWVSVLVVPYALFAVYYQRRAVRQWSIGCLGLPVVLAGAPLTAPGDSIIVKIIVLFVLPFLAAMLQIKTWRKNQENRLRKL